MAVITKIEHFKPAIFEAGIRSDVNCKGTTKISLIYVQGIVTSSEHFSRLPNYGISKKTSNKKNLLISNYPSNLNFK